ncbi:MAG TPA: DUF3365 domain-containing protein [Oceanipulchritudo sp.]|nr:DUF3365 domain-containing protein [Oceanipulchritudo sp.]
MKMPIFRHPFLVTGAALILGIHLLAAVSQPAPSEDPSPELLESTRDRAAPVARALMESLEGRLKQALGKGGPIEAIEVCQLEALPLTKSVRDRKEVTHLKRVGVRLRNPANAPDEHEAEALAFFTQNGIEAGQFPEEHVQEITTQKGATEVRYYRAITLQACCVACHGPAEQMPAPIREALQQRYPDDAATGFTPGQLRGLMVVGLTPEEE